MPIGTPQPAENVRVSVSDTFGGVYDIVDGVSTMRKNTSREVTSFAAFGRAVKVTQPGAREVTYSFPGFLSVDDTGQNKIRAAEINNTTLFVKVLRDITTNGFIQEVRIGSRTYESDANGGLQAVSFEATGVGVETIVGTGPIS